MSSSAAPTELERAFELARSGEFRNASRIRDQLRREGFFGTQIEGASLSRQLNELCRKSILALVVPPLENDPKITGD
jgi:hypothetical protein